MRSLATVCGALLLSSVSAASMVACLGDDDVLLTDQPNTDAGSVTVPDASGNTDATTDEETIELRFEAKVGALPFSCDESYTLGTPGTTAVVRDLRAYVHDVQLVDAAGASVPLALTADGLWQTDRVALLDFENGAGNCRNGTAQTNVVIRGKAPRGSYRGVTFTLGVPSDLNHADPSLASSPLTSSTMHWTWNAGYIFVRIDAEVAAHDMGDGGMDDHDDGGMDMGDGGMGHGDGGMSHGDGGMSHGDGGMSHGAPGVYLMHLGSTGCTGESSLGEPVTCSRKNLGAVALSGFDPLTQPIVVDVGALFEASDLAAPDQGGSPGCMSSANDPECGVLLTRVGVDATTGDAAPAGQKLFRAP